MISMSSSSAWRFVSLSLTESTVSEKSHRKQHPCIFRRISARRSDSSASRSGGSGSITVGSEGGTKNGGFSESELAAAEGVVREACLTTTS